MLVQGGLHDCFASQARALWARSSLVTTYPKCWCSLHRTRTQSQSVPRRGGAYNVRGSSNRRSHGMIA